MYKRVACFLLFLIIVLTQIESLFASNVPNVTKEMQFPEFWINNFATSSEVVMNEEEIRHYNEQLVKEGEKTGISDLKSYHGKLLSKESLTQLLNTCRPPLRDFFTDGKPVPEEVYKALEYKTNTHEVKETNPIRYGFSVKKTNIRFFPSNLPFYSTPNSIEFDFMQHTLINAAEPLIVLHKSTDDNWLFVQTQHVIGWALKSDIAIASSAEEWFSYFEPENFLIITGNCIKLGFNPYSKELSELEIGMSTKLPFIPEDKAPPILDNQTTAGSYVVQLPTRDDFGMLKIKETTLPMVNDVSIGYLPYTRENVLKQAFKMLGNRYGWGGMFNSRDCSSFIWDVYKCFGIMFPRNSKQMADSPGATVDFKELTTEKRMSALNKIPPGSTLQMDGHVLMYLGDFNGQHFAIHSFFAYGDIEKREPDGIIPNIFINSVIVSRLDLPRKKSGTPLIDNIISSKLVLN